jgi:hypothetical protein
MGVLECTLVECKKGKTNPGKWSTKSSTPLFPYISVQVRFFCLDSYKNQILKLITATEQFKVWPLKRKTTILWTSEICRASRFSLNKHIIFFICLTCFGIAHLKGLPYVWIIYMCIFIKRWHLFIRLWFILQLPINFDSWVVRPNH